MPGQRVGRKEAWQEWVEDGERTAELLKVTNGVSQCNVDDSLSTWKGEQESRKQRKDACPQETDDARWPGLMRKRRRRWKKDRPPPLEGRCVQNAAEANPPGPPGPVLESDGGEAKNYQ